MFGVWTKRQFVLMNAYPMRNITSMELVMDSAAVSLRLWSPGLPPGSPQIPDVPWPRGDI